MIKVKCVPIIKVNYDVPNETILVTPDDTFSLDKKLNISYGDKKLLVWGLILIKDNMNKELISEILSKREKYESKAEHSK